MKTRPRKTRPTSLTPQERDRNDIRDLFSEAASFTGRGILTHDAEEENEEMGSWSNGIKRLEEA